LTSPWLLGQDYFTFFSALKILYFYPQIKQLSSGVDRRISSKDESRTANIPGYTISDFAGSRTSLTKTIFPLTIEMAAFLGRPLHPLLGFLRMAVMVGDNKIFGSMDYLAYMKGRDVGSKELWANPKGSRAYHRSW
jgi:hypothetical protein